MRWLLMPKATEGQGKGVETDVSCIFTPFSVRHKASAGSLLDTVRPLGPVTLHDGAATVYGRYVGICKITSRLGRVHEPIPNLTHRDITIILFTRGKWSRAVKVGSAFAGELISHNTIVLLARALVDNYARAVQAVHRHKEDTFNMKTYSWRQTAIWQQFMARQMSQMPPMNDGIAYLASIARGPVTVDAVVVIADDGDLPKGELTVIDLGGRTLEDKCIFMIVAEAALQGPAHPTWHKVAMTLPLAESLDEFVSALPLQPFTIGGDHCEMCRVLVQQRSAGVGAANHAVRLGSSLSVSAPGIAPVPVKRKKLLCRWPARPVMKLRSLRQ